MAHRSHYTPKIWFSMAAAIGGKARYIVSGDKALLRVGTYPNGSVVSPAAFLSRAR